MKPARLLSLSLLCASLLLSACTTSAPAASPTQALVGVSPALPATSTPASTQPAPVTLTLLYTDDEHGWMAGGEESDGAAELMGLWQADFAAGRDPNLLILSGGDNWTGPAISTWFDGQGMVEVMNQMGYAASAVGNHEFDFGLDVLKTRLGEAHFPFLSANLRLRADGSLSAGLGIQPYVLLPVGGLQVGVIGLSTTVTPLTTNPKNVADFEFTGYAQALRQYVPQMRQEGADVVVLTSHVCPEELLLLAVEVSDLDIPFMGGGHCHTSFTRRVGDTFIATSGADLTGYVYTRLIIDPASGQASLIDYGWNPNRGGQADEAVAGLVAEWQQRADAELDVEIGYLENEIPRQSQAMQDLITESWLSAYPADIALTNLGGMRDRLPAGALTIAEIIGVMPFNNVLVELHLTGEQLLDVLRSGSRPLAVGGMRQQAGGWVLNATGEALALDQEYSVLVNDFMYAGGDGYEMLARYDPNAYNTAIDWRQPVLDWITAQDSSSASPLNEAIARLGGG